jgi:hypothetical protein
LQERRRIAEELPVTYAWSRDGGSYGGNRSYTELVGRTVHQIAAGASQELPLVWCCARAGA